MSKKRHLKLPTSQAFWRAYVGESREINTFMEDDTIADLISEIINLDVGSAEGAAAVLWYMTEGSDVQRQRELAEQAAERWLDLVEIAVNENPTASAQTFLHVQRERWQQVVETFVGFVA